MNIPLYLLSFEYDTQDDLISMLIEPRSYERYTSGENRGRQMPLISDANVLVLEQYQKMSKAIGKKPSIELLKQKFPTLVFDNVVPLKQEQLEETIKLDLETLKQKNQSRMLLNLSSKVNVNGLTEEVIDDLLSLTKEESSTTGEYKSILGDVKEIYDKSKLVKGIKTGVSQIDERTGGLQPGTFNTLAGFAGAGKTTAAVNIAYNAMKEEKNVCYITLEVPKLDMVYDLLSRHSFEKEFKKPISHSHIKKRELSKEDSEYLFTEVLNDFREKMEKHLFILDETDFVSYSFSMMEAKIKECDTLATANTGHGIDLLIIDQAQLLKFGGGIDKAGNETSVINLYVSFFRQQAINFLHSKRTCTVLMLSQINRDGYNYACKHNGQYSLTNLAEANELERASAMVIALFTDESLKSSKQVSIQLLKSRNGETIIDPVMSSMDPVYYVFGSEATQTSAVFTGAGDTIFGSVGDTLDLTGIANIGAEIDMGAPIDLGSIQGGDL